MPYRYPYTYQQPISPLGAFMQGISGGIGSGMDIFLRKQQREQLEKERQTLENKSKVNDFVKQAIEGDPTFYNAILQTKEGRMMLRDIGADKNPVIANLLEETTPQPFSPMPFQAPSQQQETPMMPTGQGGVGAMASMGADPFAEALGMPGPVMPGPAMMSPEPVAGLPVAGKDVDRAMAGLLEVAPEMRKQRITEELAVFMEKERIKTYFTAEVKKMGKLSPQEAIEWAEAAANEVMRRHGNEIFAIQDMTIAPDEDGNPNIRYNFYTKTEKEAQDKIKAKEKRAEQKAEDVLYRTQKKTWNGLVEEFHKEYQQDYSRLNSFAKTGSSSDVQFLLGDFDEGEAGLVSKRDRLEKAVEIANDKVKNYNEQLMGFIKDPTVNVINITQEEAERQMKEPFHVDQFLEADTLDTTKDLDNQISAQKKKQEEAKSKEKTKIRIKGVETDESGKTYAVLSNGTKVIIKEDGKGKYIIINGMKARHPILNEIGKPEEKIEE